MAYYLASTVRVLDDLLVDDLGQRTRTIDDPAAVAVAQTARNGATRREIQNRVPDLEPDTLTAVLDGLVQTGFVVSLPDPLTPASAARWASLGLGLHAAGALAASARIEIEAPESVHALLRGAVADWSLASDDRDDEPTLRVVAVPALHAIQASVADDISPTLVVVPTSDGALAVDLGAEPRRVVGRLHAAAAAALLGTPPLLPLCADAGDAIGRLVAARVAGGRSLATGSVTRIVGARVVQTHPVAAAHPPAPTGVHPLLQPAPSPVAPLALLDGLSGIAFDSRETGRFGDAVASAVRYRVPGRPPRAAGGKGWNALSALTSALYEAAEHTSAQHHPDRETLLASANDLGDRALLPHHLDGFSDAQRAATHPEHPLLRVPDLLDPDRRILWVRAWPLRPGDPIRWAPAAHVFGGFDAQDHSYAFAHSNGCAGGPDYASAAEAALLEVIERDAVTAWFCTRTPRPPVQIALGPRIASVRSALLEAGRELHVLDITHDLGIPVCVAVSYRTTGAPGWTLGFGAAVTLRQAAERAVLELAQTLPATDRPDHPDPLPWSDSPEPAAYLLPHTDAVATPARAVVGPLLADLEARLAGAGLDAFLVDQTHPLLGIPTLKAIVPGTAFWWRRHGSSRIAESPVRAGWRLDRVPEEDLNPLSLTL